MRYLIPMYQKLQSTLKDEKGATMVEYALMVALIAVACVAAVGLVGGATNTTFGTILASL